MPDLPPDIPESESADIGPHRTHLRRLRQRLGAWLSTCRRLFPLTWAGFFTLTAGMLGWYTLGIRHRDWVIASASFVLGACVILLLLGVLINAYRLWYCLNKPQLPQEPFKFVGGHPSTTPFVLKLGYFPFTEITWSWTFPKHVDVETTSNFSKIIENITARQRCQVDHITRSFVVRDVLGLACMKWEHRFDTAITVLPREEQFETNQVLPSISDGDEDANPYGAPKGDRIEMRKYSQGDSSRDIIWKVYARTRKLMVRVPERAVTSQPRSCAYLVAAAGDTVSANLALTILQRRMLGENWAFGADGTPGMITSIGPAIQALSRSGNYAMYGPEKAHTTGLSHFLQEAEARGFNNCLVFVPNRLAPPAPPLLSRWKRFFRPQEGSWPEWASVAKGALRGRQMTVTWMMGVSHLEADQKPQAVPEKPPWRQQLEQIALKPVREYDDQVQATAKALSGANTQVWIYDSSTRRFSLR